MPEQQPLACPICGHTEHQFVNKPRPHLTMLKCDNCGVIFVVPLWKHAVAKDVFTNFDGWPGGLIGGAENRDDAMRFMAHVIKQNKPQKGRLLDIGCANGIFFNIMQREAPGWELYGTDPDPRWRDFDYTGVEVRVGSLHEAQFPAQFFDAVTVLDALYYIPDLVDEMQEIARILKPGGLLVFDIPNQTYLQVRGLLGRVLRLKRTRTFAAYPFYFSERSIELLLDQAGIEIVDKLPDRGAIQHESYLRMLMSSYIAVFALLARIFPGVRGLFPKAVYVGRRASGA